MGSDIGPIIPDESQSDVKWLTLLIWAVIIVLAREKVSGEPFLYAKLPIKKGPDNFSCCGGEPALTHERHPDLIDRKLLLNQHSGSGHLPHLNVSAAKLPSCSRRRHATSICGGRNIRFLRSFHP